MNLYPLGAIIAGQYEVAGRPLMGGMGIVYLCLDHANDKRPVALKTFKPEYLPDRAARDRFLREGTMWVNLGAHLHIVRCYQVVQSGTVLEVYLVLELVAKEQGREDASLRSWLTPGNPLPVEQALLFALQIARGMRHAADTIPGFVHRDLKPENVLVGADRMSNASVNRVRVTDFGLASVLQDSGGDQPLVADPRQGTVGGQLGRTQLTHGIIGTPLYMAPEQWMPGTTIDARADVYAFGCILHEMLTGRYAVTGKSLRELEQSHRAGQVGELPRGLPEKVSALVQRCQALDRKERYWHWEEVETEVASAYRQATTKEAPPKIAADGETRAGRVAAGWSYNTIGISYHSMGKYDVAVGYLERVVQIGQAEKDRALEGAGLGNLAGAYDSLGDSRRAVEYHAQHLVIAREIGDWQGEGIALGNLGNAHFSLGEYRRAIEYYKRALVIAREIGDRRGEGRALGNLGNVHCSLGEYRRAIEYHEQYLAIAREIGDRKGEGTALGNLGAAYYSLGDSRRAVEYHAQHLVIAREIGDRQGEGDALGNLGNFHFSVGDYRRAIEYHEQCLAIACEIGDRKGEGHALNNLGIAYKNLGDYRRAIGHYERCLIIAREIGDRKGEGTALGNLGNAYDSLGESRRAVEYHAQHLAIAHEIGDRQGEGIALGNLGNVHYSLGDVRQAIGIYEKALAIKQEIGDMMGAAITSLNLAQLLFTQSRQTEALRHAQYAAQVFAQIGHATYAQQARQWVVRLQSSKTAFIGPTPTEILAKFAPLIELVVAAVQGNGAVRAELEQAFEESTQADQRIPIAGPIQRIWAGERDEAKLTAGIDPNSTLIVREILRRLK